MSYREPQMNIRVYLSIPYCDKDNAKELGCKWYCIDSDKGKSNVSICIQKWDYPEPYKIVNDNIVLLSEIADINRGFTT